jgi:putative tricarboxylic transport membrane protein
MPVHVPRRVQGSRYALAALIALAGVHAPAQQARAPIGNIEVVVGSGAGATPDVLMRRMAKVLNERRIIANPIVIVNRPGGSWMTAANFVLARKKNENLVFSVVPTIFTTPLVQHLPATYERLTPLSYLVHIDLVVVGRVDGKAKNLRELLDLAKLKPRSVSVAGANVGSTDQMVTTQLEKVAGVRLNYVPFDGGTGILQAFLGGNVDMVILALDEAYPLLRGGRAKALALLSDGRRTEPELNAIPTAREQGVDLVWGQDFGLAGPPELAPDVAAWWEQRLALMVETDEWKKMMRDSFLTTSFTRRAETGKRMVELNALYKRVLNPSPQAGR